MERINPSGKASYKPADRSKKKGRQKPTQKTTFTSFISNHEKIEESAMLFEELGISNEASLEEMLDSVHSIGDQVKDNATYATIGKYRGAVRSFMKYVLENALVVEERNSSPNILRQKKFTLVQVINQKLDRLASGLLAGQREALDVLAGIDEINGLLVDLTR
ncbi:MAG: YaaR family protein [Spirochaetales bacterium]|jgi:uncharacterized protein|nr:YaaR family protein [Spirochaetales bacterium]